MTFSFQASQNSVAIYIRTLFLKYTMSYKYTNSYTITMVRAFGNNKQEQGVKQIMQ